MHDVRPGQRIRVRQMIARREGAWSSEVIGEVLSVGDEPTGSWFAHGKDDKLWLHRLRLRKPDGDITTVTVDQHTHIEVLEPAPDPG
ncbi:MAG: hypothetical protein CHACPFDD_03853 [Phycisphaerae bacterium]|nr:hypothetical protein [Phycisphaerae bacterium]